MSDSAKVKSINEDIRFYEQLISESTNNEVASSYNKQLSQLKSNLNEVVSSIQVTNPHYTPEGRVNPSSGTGRGSMGSVAQGGTKVTYGTTS